MSQFKDSSLHSGLYYSLKAPARVQCRARRKDTGHRKQEQESQNNSITWKIENFHHSARSMAASSLAIDQSCHRSGQDIHSKQSPLEWSTPRAAALAFPLPLPITHGARSDCLALAGRGLLNATTKRAGDRSRCPATSCEWAARWAPLCPPVDKLLEGHKSTHAFQSDYPCILGSLHG